MLRTLGVSPLELGTTLLRKYRIDRIRLETRDATLYEATDECGRRVCITVLRRDRLTSDDTRDANVIDIGRTTGLPYVVTAEFERAPAPAVEDVPIPIVVEEPEPERSPVLPWVVIAVTATIVCFAFWFIGPRRSHPAPATMAADVTTAEPTPPPTAQKPVVAKPPATHNEEVTVAPPARHRRKPAMDPLTL